MLIIVVMKLIAPRIDDTPARCRRKLLDQLKLLHGLSFQLKVGIRFIQYPPRLLLLRMPVVIGRMVEVVRNLCCLYVERPYRELRLLAVRVSYQNPQS